MKRRSHRVETPATVPCEPGYGVPALTELDLSRVQRTRAVAAVLEAARARFTCGAPCADVECSCSAVIQ